MHAQLPWEAPGPDGQETTQAPSHGEAREYQASPDVRAGDVGRRMPSLGARRSRGLSRARTGVELSANARVRDLVKQERVQSSTGRKEKREKVWRAIQNNSTLQQL